MSTCPCRKKVNIEECKSCYDQTQKSKQVIKATITNEKQIEKQYYEQKVQQLEKLEIDELQAKKNVQEKYKQDIKTQVELESKKRNQLKSETKQAVEGFYPNGTQQYQEKMQKIKSKKEGEIIESSKAIPQKSGEIVTPNMEKEYIVQEQRFIKKQISDKNATITEQKEVPKLPIKYDLVGNDFQTKDVAKKTLLENKELNSYKREINQKAKEEERKKDMQAKEEALRQEQVLQEKKAKERQKQREDLQKAQQLIAEKKKSIKEQRAMEAAQFVDSVKKDESNYKEQEAIMKQRKQEATMEYDKSLTEQAIDKKSKPKDKSQVDAGLNLDSYKRMKANK